MRDYLEFEKPIREIEEKIEKLAAVPAGKSAPQDEIRKLRMKLAQVEQTLYSKLNPLAAHATRPASPTAQYPRLHQLSLQGLS